MSSANKGSFTSSFSNWIPFIIFLAYCTDQNLQNNAEWQRCFIPDLRGKAFSLSPLTMVLPVAFLDGLYQLEKFLCIPGFLSMFFFCFFFLNKFILFIYFWLRWVFIAVHGLSLVAVSRGYSSFQCAGFSLRWLLLLRSTGSRRLGFSSCGMQVSVVVACGL